MASFVFGIGLTPFSVRIARSCGAPGIFVKRLPLASFKRGAEAGTWRAHERPVAELKRAFALHEAHEGAFAPTSSEARSSSRL